MKIKQNQLAQTRHVKFLMRLEKQALLGYKLVTAEINAEIKRSLRSDRLAKSDDDDSLGKGWTGEVPKIEVDLDKTVSKVVNKYMQAMRWLMLGDYAGKEARKVAEEIGMVGKFVPGLIGSAYLQSIDTHREHREDITEEESPKIPQNILKETLKRIIARADRFIEKLFNDLKLSYTQAIDNITQDANFKNLNAVHKEAHDSLPVSGSDAVTEAADLAKDTASMRLVNESLGSVAESYEKKWNTTAQMELATSSAMGTHQAMYEVYGAKDDNVRVVVVTTEDERLCSFCNEASKDHNGNFKYYKLSDFKPTGFNYGKKKSEWVLTIMPSHVSCRCSIVYVPRGFEIDKDGTITAKK